MVFVVHQAEVAVAKLMCRMNGWRCQVGDDGPFGADVSIDVWIDGGKIGGRIAGRVVRESSGAPFVLEDHGDDFQLESDMRNDLLVEVYRMVGRLPDYAEGSSVEPTPFSRWLCRRWDYSRVRELAVRMEATIRENVPEPLASGEAWFQ